MIGAKSMKEMVATLKKPRRVMMLVKAGSAVDAFIEQLVGLKILLLFHPLFSMKCGQSLYGFCNNYQLLISNATF